MTSDKPIWPAAFLALLAALLTWLAMPAIGWPLVAFIALVPLALALGGISPGRGFLLGLLYGFAWWLIPGLWLAGGMVSLVKVSQPLSWVFTLIFCLIQAAPYGAFGLVCGFMNRRGRPLSPLRAALWLAALVAAFPAVIPLNLAHGLYTWPLFIQLADMGSYPLVLFWLVLVNWLLAGLLTRQGKTARLAVVLALVLAVVSGYGWLRLGQYGQPAESAADALTLTAMAVQPDIPIPGDQRGRQIRGETVSGLMAWTAREALAHPNTELIIWPETPWTLGCGQDLPGEQIRSMLAGPRDRRLLIPCLETIIDHSVPPQVKTYHQVNSRGQRSTGTVTTYQRIASYAAAAMWDRSGQHEGLHRKTKRFPFGEYLPFAGHLPWLGNLFPKVQGVDAGKRPVLMDLGNSRRLIPTLCYETLWPQVVLMGAGQGGNVIAAMGNDAWFGQTKAGAFHLAMALFRSVETRMPLIRVSNSGYSAHISAAGEILPGSLTPAFERLVSVHALAIPGQRAPFIWLGTWLGWAALMLCILDLLLCLRRPKSRARKIDGLL